MIGKLLQAIGLLTLLGMFTAVIAGTVLLNDRVHIVVQQGAAGETPDATARLGDDLQQLRTLVEQNARLVDWIEQLAGATHPAVVAPASSSTPAPSVGGDVAVLAVPW